MAGRRYIWRRYVFLLVSLVVLTATYSSTFRDPFIQKDNKEYVNEVCYPFTFMEIDGIMGKLSSQNQGSYAPSPELRIYDKQEFDASDFNDLNICLLVLAILMHLLSEIHSSHSSEELVTYKLKLENSDCAGKSHTFLHRLLSILNLKFDKEDTFSILGCGCALSCYCKTSPSLWLPRCKLKCPNDPYRLWNKKQKWQCMKGNTWVDHLSSWMRNYIAYPAFHLLASYRNLTGLEANQNSPSFIELSEAGFGYTGESSLVRCNECGKNLEISSITEKPDDPKYHQTGCKFASSSGSESQKGGFSKDDVIETDAVAQISQFKPNHSEPAALTESEFNCHKENTISRQEIQSSGGAGPSLSGDVPSNDGTHKQNSGPINGESQTTNDQAGPFTSVSPQQTLVSNTFPSTSSDSSGSASNDYTEGINTASASTKLWNSAASDFLANYGKEHPDGEWFYDKEAYRSEKLENKSNDLSLALPAECQKNPGHFAYISVSRLTLDNLPWSVRCPEVLRLLHLCAMLTVRILVKDTSKSRRDANCYVGTGSCLIDLYRSYYEPSGKWKTVWKHLPFVKRNFGQIYIETSRHIVLNDSVAANTTVEFFYNRQNRKDVRIVKGIEVKHSHSPGDYKSILVCQTTDLELVEKLNSYREELFRLARNMPQNIHEALTNKIFVIGHPHGGEKVLSYGESVVVKYMLKSETLTMEKVNNQQQLPRDISSVRKVLLYTADTCEGSSGSPVLTFKSVPGGMELDLWMHNGFDIKHELSGSVMKVLSAEDIVNHGKPTRSRRSEVNQNAGDGLSSFSAVVQGPMFTVIGHPAHPAYTAYDKRLDSFANWAYEHIQPKEQLTRAGFFYAGYADCARCFQCGLGLRTWKAGDDVYREHYKHKPTCQFLQTQLRVKGITDPERQLLQAAAPRVNDTHRNDASSRSSEADTMIKEVLQGTVPQPQVTAGACILRETHASDSSDLQFKVLQEENKILQKRLTCKVCYQKTIKDLFLPCGELYACTECSQLLSHCPSCGKEIHATVTIYFT